MGKILVSGAAGFIGFHLCKRLIAQGDEVVGIDNINDYYDINLKHSRLNILNELNNFKFIKIKLEDKEPIFDIFKKEKFNRVINLAAQAGVRYSVENPMTYINSNIVGFANILEACRHFDIEHLVYASSSSVYGANTKMPFSTHHNVDHPLSLYAASKKSNELMAHTYSHLFGLPTTGLRFFTVYGPWGRPDMALFLFTKAILNEEPIKVFNHGKMKRDFTYIDDIVEGITRLSERFPEPNPYWTGDNPDPGTSTCPYRIFNIGNNRPIELLKVIDTLESAIGKKAKKVFMDIQPGDVPATFADIDDLEREINYRPNTPIDKGIKMFVEWYRSYYNC